jgi:hypothetical protein
MKTIQVPNGIIHICESKVECPHCTRPMPIDEFEDAMWKSKQPYIRKKCVGCKRFFGIAQKMNGDFIGFELNNKK